MGVTNDAAGALTGIGVSAGYSGAGISTNLSSAHAIGLSTPGASLTYGFDTGIDFFQHGFNAIFFNSFVAPLTGQDPVPIFRPDKDPDTVAE